MSVYIDVQEFWSAIRSQTDRFFISSDNKNQKLIINSEFCVNISFEINKDSNYFEKYIRGRIDYPGFDALFLDFRSWYNKENTPKIKKISFLYFDFDQIAGRSHLKSSNINDLDEFINQTAMDINGRVGNWIENWRVPSKALELMEDDENLCGVWREIAYWCVLERVRGRSEAIRWLGGVEVDKMPYIPHKQISFLREILQK